MDELSFELALPGDARAIEQIKNLCATDLTRKLGPGHWSGATRLQTLQERLRAADPDLLARKTYFVCKQFGQPIGTIAVSSATPSFWRSSVWLNPDARALGVFGLSVSPSLARQGVGRFLMQQTEILALSKGFEFIRLDAYEANPYSQNFYDRIGYSRRGETEVRGVKLILFEKQLERSDM